MIPAARKSGTSVFVALLGVALGFMSLECGSPERLKHGVTGTAGTGTGAAGTGSNALDGCNHVNWTFTAPLICDPATIPNCGFCNTYPTQCGPQYAIDGDTTTRYTDGRTQVGGEYVILAFGSTIKLSGV